MPRSPTNYGDGYICCMCFVPILNVPLRNFASLLVGTPYPSHRQEVGIDNGSHRAAAHYLDGIITCNRCDWSKAPDFHEYGSFIRGTFLH